MQDPIKLIPSVQNYEWGKVGGSSLVADLTGNSRDDKPYAELWIGNHPKAPSRVAGDESRSLSQVLAGNPQEWLGDKVIAKFGAQLPFLLKVLSIRDVLSIQAHPNKELAQKLRREDPEHYPDANHKPEMAIALTELELLYGFQDREGLKGTFARYPALIPLISDPIVQTELTGISTSMTDEDLTCFVYTAFMLGHEKVRTRVVSDILAGIAVSTDRSSFEERLAGFAATYGPSDPGILSSLVMNYVKLTPGEGLYIGPNIPHAYICGDIIECMATSDNVVRAGLTPKFKDEKVLLRMLDYRVTLPARIAPEQIDDEPFVLRYPTPAPEFEVCRMQAESGSGRYSCAGRPTLLFALEGEAAIVPHFGSRVLLQRGEAVLLPAALVEYTLTFDKADLVRVTTGG